MMLEIIKIFKPENQAKNICKTLSIYLEQKDFITDLFIFLIKTTKKSIVSAKDFIAKIRVCQESCITF